MNVVFLDSGGTVDQVVERNRDREGTVIAEGSAEQEFIPDVGALTICFRLPRAGSPESSIGGDLCSHHSLDSSLVRQRMNSSVWGIV